MPASDPQHPARANGLHTLAGAAILVAGAWLRLTGLLRTPLWLDEAYSAYAVENGFRFMWSVVPTYDVHPPLYYTFLGLWSVVAGDSLAGLRMLGLVCGLTTIAFAVMAGRELARALDVDERLLAGSAAALVALSPLMIDMSREVRPYPLMILAYAAAIVGMLRVGRTAGSEGSVARGPFLLYLAGLALTFWLHNVGPLFGASLTLALAALVAGKVRDRREVLLLAGGHVLVAVVYLPGFLILLDQSATWVESTWLVFRWEGLHWKLAALWGAVGIVAIVAAVLLLVVGLRRAIEGDGARFAAALAIAAVLPALLAVALSVSVAPVFLIRTLTPVTVPALLLIAAGVASAKGRWRWGTIAVLGVLLSQMVVVDLNARRGGPREDWYGTVRWLVERMRPGDVIYAYPNEGVLPLGRAAKDVGLSLPMRPIPTAVPASGVGWHPTGNRGTVSLPREMLRAIAAEPETRGVPTVWLLRLGPWSYDKGDVFLEELSRDRVVVDRFRNGPIDIVGLRVTSDE
jgi:mannosyltransferase